MGSCPTMEKSSEPPKTTSRCGSTVYCYYSMLTSMFTSSLVTLSLGNFTYCTSHRLSRVLYSTVQYVVHTGGYSFWLSIASLHTWVLNSHVRVQNVNSRNVLYVPHKTLKTECPPLAKPPSPQNVSICTRLLSQNVPIKKCPNTKNP